MLADLRDRLRRRVADAETSVMAGLVALLLVLLVAASLRPGWLPYSSVLIPVFVASQYLGPRRLPLFTALALLVAVVLVVHQPPQDVRGALRVVVVVCVGVLVLLASHRRVRLGVAGSRGEAMLVELRDRILAQGRLPGLPEGWSARLVLDPAGGTAFAGDFVVADLSGTTDRPRLRVALVDVSGKGIDAGTRSLLLSGAMGGLLAALPAEEFLPAANRFLLRQEWEEGFATAVLLEVDLARGEVAVRTAGHPPPVLLGADGSWRLLEATGPALGLLDDAEHDVVRTRLEPGEALLLYTDGVVEQPGHDISEGTELLAVRAQQQGAPGTGIDEERLLGGLGNVDDDRALLVLQRG